MQGGTKKLEQQSKEIMFDLAVELAKDERTAIAKKYINDVRMFSINIAHNRNNNQKQPSMVQKVKNLDMRSLHRYNEQ